MPDFGARWQIVSAKPIGKGGQSHAYLVRDAEGNVEDRYVAKVLNGINDPLRRQRLEREIASCREFNHPNVVRLIDAGLTGNSNYPFLVLPYYEHGSLGDFRALLGDNPTELLSFFAKICDGVAYVHEKGVIHRDIKPANIFVNRDRQPIVGDFGISFRDAEDRVTQPMEVVAPRWFGAPELRNGYLENPTRSADVYSLGKLLYWLFAGKVYDREEQDYCANERKLAAVLDGSVPAYSFVDQLVEATVRYDPNDRKIPGAKNFAGVVRQTIERIKAGGHVLNLRLPQRCIFCGLGTYRAAHEENSLTGPPRPGQMKFSEIEQRQVQENPTYPEQSKYATMRNAARNLLAAAATVGIPLVLICDYCGNVQYFRWDLAQDGYGKNWRP